MELFRKEIMTNVKYEDHIKEHQAINKMFNVDCDTLSVPEHLNLHIEYQFKIGKLTKEQYNRYRPSQGRQEK